MDDNSIGLRLEGSAVDVLQKLTELVQLHSLIDPNGADSMRCRCFCWTEETEPENREPQERL
jgi:hypothetical protein